MRPCRECGEPTRALTDTIELCGDCMGIKPMATDEPWQEQPPEALERTLHVIATPEPAPKTAPLLREIIRTLERYIVLPGNSEALTLALYVLHTWTIAGADTTPYIVVDSAERRSGKSRLLELLRELVRKPEPVANLSEAAMYRLIDTDEPTLLLDEVDAIFGQNTERTEALRGLLNAGNRRGTTVARCVGPGHNIKRFATFCPKVLSGINEGRLPDTIRDRAVTITMKRRLDSEPIERMRPRKLATELNPLRARCAAWAEANTAALTDAEPDLPEDLDDRAAEAWEPLLAIAELAGDTCTAAARRAADHLSGGELDDDEGTPGRRVLAGIRAVWSGEWMTSADLCTALNADDDLGFGRWSDGKGIDPVGLSKYLRPYKIKTDKWRDGTVTRRGYKRSQFEDAWSRHLGPVQDTQPGASVAGVAGVAGFPGMATNAIFDTGS